MNAARLGALALAAAIAACSGGANSLAPAGQSIPATTTSVGAASVNPMFADSCTLTSKENFDNDPISAGSWILFTSIFDIPTGKEGLLRFHMKKSSITLTNGSNTYTINTPDARISLHDPNNHNIHLNFAPAMGKVKHNVWWLMAPYGESGNYFMNDVVWQVPANLDGGIKDVTWQATFTISKYGVGESTEPIHWRWGAAVYTTLQNSNYNGIGVKALDAAYGPASGLFDNGDPAGTPENYKSYLTLGGTQQGQGGDYTGAGNGHVQNICR